MRAGRHRWSWRLGGVLALALGLAAGCASDAPRLEHALLADRDPAAHGADLEEHYVVHCPDQLALEVDGLPDGRVVARSPDVVAWSPDRATTAVCEVGADGRIALPDGGRLNADGLTAAEIGRSAAEQLGLPEDRVRVEVVGYNSQQIYLFGEVAGRERAVPYQGPETVLDLLQRVGGVAAGAAVGDVQVVRGHVADGGWPELFHVDLDAILTRHDQRTNVRLEPFDQIYIGQTKRSSLKGCFPPWLRPVYERLCGMPRGRPQGD